MIWIVISLTAAFLQAIRSGLQKSLNAHMPPEMVVWTRFIFGLPLAALYVGGLIVADNMIPDTSALFFLLCFMAGILQIIGNLCLVQLFKRRNFVIGVTYTKVEALLSAAIAAIIFAEYVSWLGLVAIIISLLGIVIITIAEQHIEPLSLFTRLASPSVFLGFAAGLCYAFTGVFIRQASIGLPTNSILMSSALTLLTMILIQSTILGIWVLYRYSGVQQTIKANLRKSVTVGGVATLTSICWFTAFTMVPASYVNVVGQTEIIFSLLMTHALFKESTNKLEYIGIIMVLVGVVTMAFV